MAPESGADMVPLAAAPVPGRPDVTVSVKAAINSKWRPEYPAQATAWWLSQQLGANKGLLTGRVGCQFRSVYQEIFQNVFIVSRGEWPPANFAIDRPIDRLGSRIDPHDFVTCPALRALELLGLILGHRLTISGFSKC